MNINNRIIIGIVPDKSGNESYSEKWTLFLSRLNVEVREVKLKSNFDLNELKLYDGIMWRWLHQPMDKISAKNILFALEKGCNIPTFPNIGTAWHYDDKIAQNYLLKSLNAPIVDTFIFWNIDQARQWVKENGFPFIFKLSSGAGSSNVLKIENWKTVDEILHKCFYTGHFPYSYNEFADKKKKPFGKIKSFLELKSKLAQAYKYLLYNKYPAIHGPWWVPEKGYAYFQEFLPDNKYDTRVTVIGNRAFAFRRFNRPNDFRASGSGNFDVDPEKIDKRCLEVAFKVSHIGGFQTMAYDFLYDKNHTPKIVEISYTFVDSALHKCPGYWDSELNWHQGHMWPQEAQVIDFIDIIEKRKDR